MSREIASSTRACVEGPKASRSACRMRRLELDLEVERHLGIVRVHEVVDESDGDPAGLETDLLLAVLVDHVVAPLGPGRAGLAVARLGAGEVLELECEVLGDVSHPRPLAQAADEATPPPERAGVVLERRHHPDKRIGEVRDRVAGPAFEVAEVDEHAHDRLGRPVVRAAEDAALEDPQRGAGALPVGGAVSPCRRVRGGRPRLALVAPAARPAHGCLSLSGLCRPLAGYSDATSAAATGRSAGVAIRTRRRRSKR